MLLFVSPAFFLEVDAHDARRELREEPGGADHANQIGDGKGDGNPVGHRGRVGRRQAQPRDGVARRADRRRLGQRAGDDARRGAGIVAEELG